MKCEPLTPEEREDLKVIAKHYRLCTRWVHNENLTNAEKGYAVDVNRRRLLAARIEAS